MFGAGVAYAVDGLIRTCKAGLSVGISQHQAAKSREARGAREARKAIVGPATDGIQVAEAVEHTGSGAGELEIGAVGAEVKFIYEIASKCCRQADRRTLSSLVSGGGAQITRQEVVVKGIRVSETIVGIANAQDVFG